MSDTSEKDLDKMFPEDLSTADLHRVVKRARRFTILRNFGISVVSSIAVLAAGLLLNNELLARTEQTVRAAAFLATEVSNPDVYLGNEHSTFGLFGGQAQYQTYKIINGVPIPWGTETYVFNVLGGYSQMLGNDSPSPQIQTANGVRVYNYQTQQREMEFYYPGGHYQHYFNDLSQLKKVPADDQVEMAISFDKSYKYSQVKSVLPTGVHAAWYWVDTYGEFMKQSSYVLMPHEVYGFGTESFPDDTAKMSAPQSFIQVVNDGMKLKGIRQWFQQIFDTLSHGKGGISPSDIRIIGVVVTGTPKDLTVLKGKPYVKAAVLGAIANPYHS